MQHHFDTKIAKIYGVNVAIFLDQMSFWIQKNMANNHNFHDGTYWTRNTAEAYTIIFPYWTAKQIRKIIKDCEKYGLIKIGTYNTVKYDQTRWYALTEESAKLLNISIFPDGKIKVTKKEIQSTEKVTPIPVTNTVTNTVTRESTAHKKRSPLSDDFSFNEENSKLCFERKLVESIVLDKFKTYVKAKGVKAADWQAEAKLWIMREKPSTERNEEITRPKMRDFTQERLDREAMEQQQKRCFRQGAYLLPIKPRMAAIFR